MAMGVIRALRDMDKRVPEDISVVGYDGISMGRYTVPRLDHHLSGHGEPCGAGGGPAAGQPPGAEPLSTGWSPFRLVDGESVAQISPQERSGG